MTYLPDDLYSRIEESVPILCVDVVPVRHSRGSAEIGLIARDSPFESVWAPIGGRVFRGETIRDAIRRHVEDALAVGLDVPLNPQPHMVYEWFPPSIAPEDGTVHGTDPRKHSLALVFVVTLDADPTPRNEAQDFAYFAATALPCRIWPGGTSMLKELDLRRPGISTATARTEDGHQTT